MGDAEYRSKKVGLCVIAAPTRSPEFDPPKIANTRGVVIPVAQSHSAPQ